MKSVVRLANVFEMCEPTVFKTRGWWCDLTSNLNDRDILSEKSVGNVADAASVGLDAGSIRHGWRVRTEFAILRGNHHLTGNDLPCNRLSQPMFTLRDPACA